MGAIIGIGSGTGSGSVKIIGGVCAGVGLGLVVGMTDGALGISHCRSLVIYLIALVVVSP